MKLIHKLKIEKEYLFRLITGEKKQEVRLNDRDYQLGDVLDFRSDKGARFCFLITHIHSGLGLKDGYVILSLEQKKVDQ